MIAGSRRPGPLALVLAFLCGLGLATPTIAAEETFTQARLEQDGRILKIVTSSGREFRAPKIRNQAAFRTPRISPDGRQVAWLVDEKLECCTSYPVPRALALYRKGRIAHIFASSGLPVWDWTFVGNDKIAFRQHASHGDRLNYFAMHDTRSGKLLAEHNAPTDADVPKAPAWAQEVVRASESN